MTWSKLNAIKSSLSQLLGSTLHQDKNIAAYNDQWSIKEKPIKKSASGKSSLKPSRWAISQRPSLRHSITRYSDYIIWSKQTIISLEIFRLFSWHSELHIWDLYTKRALYKSATRAKSYTTQNINYIFHLSLP